MTNQIHWFPGHMNKALNEMGNKIKLVDIVIVVLDSRAPMSSFNSALISLLYNKKKIAVFSKFDLCDKDFLNEQLKILSKDFDEVLYLDITSPSSKQLLEKSINKLGEEKRNKDKLKGMKPQPIRAMVVGAPNVGKSSLINRLAGRQAAGVANKPAFTRGDKWIKVNNNFILLDTPGVLPMNYDNKLMATNLALIGCIKDDILPHTDLVIYLLDYLKQYYPQALLSRYGIETILDYEKTLDLISKKRGIIIKNFDYSKCESLLLNEFKNGLLGNISLEKNGFKI